MGVLVRGLAQCHGGTGIRFPPHNNYKKNISRTKLKGKLTEESTENENNAKKLQTVKKKFKSYLFTWQQGPCVPSLSLLGRPCQLQLDWPQIA